MQHRNSILQNTDWVLISLFVALALMGWLNIYAASYNPEHASIFDTSQEYGKQFIWLLTSLFLGSVIFLLESRFLIKLSYPAFAVSIILLICVLVFGREVNGAKSWFGVGSFGIQPSEISKVGTTMAIALFLSSAGININSFKTKFLAVCILAFPAALILLQPDTGTMLVFVGFVFMFYREGISGNILFIGILGIIIAVIALLMNASTFNIPFVQDPVSGEYVLIGVITLIAFAIFLLIRYLVLRRYRKQYFIFLGLSFIISIGFLSGINYAVNNVLSPHQTKRVNILLGLEEDPQGAGYNVKQSKIAIGSGGFAGKGYLNGTLTKFKYVPMQSTDFIFCTVGEEWGFLGTFVVVGTFLFLIFRILFIAERQRSSYTRIFAYCIASILFMHLTINVGMTIGLAPVIGIPLPFFSYGGSSLWAFAILIFALARLDAQRLDILR